MWIVFCTWTIIIAFVVRLRAVFFVTTAIMNSKRYIVSRTETRMDEKSCRVVRSRWA